jgi:hypothetical protein
MRHTFAALNILAGEPAKWVSEQLGHADVTVTLSIYAKWFRMVRRGAADAHGTRVFGYRNDDGTTPVPSPAAVGTAMAPQGTETDANSAPTLH